MRILFCCQFYAPSVGGVQEVIRQLAERMAKHGHQVTVATTKLPNRDFDVLNQVAIRSFEVSGNLVSGMSGEIAAYHDLLLSKQFDVVLVYAAQQWTFDAMWAILDKLETPKVFVPCGFSGLYEPAYGKYFESMPAILKHFDCLVFHASQYRDIDFARERGLAHLAVLANGASEVEFGVSKDQGFRARHDISESSFLFLTVGSFTGLKGHLELVRAFSRLELNSGEHATLILNGNDVQALERGLGGLLGKLRRTTKTYGVWYAARQIWARLFGVAESPRKIAEAINRDQPNKRVLLTDFARSELVQAYMAADLFVFASNIEYSPLVLFESAAAGTPFLTVDVGNALEIAQWTGAGIACPSWRDARGYTRVDEKVLAAKMLELMERREELHDLGSAGRRAWLQSFTWEKIAIQYEQMFSRLTQGRSEAGK